mmetsp:Transcript_11025/g.33042  ORF Transcript_11025/g.33042 Transcript_11025/m.33042 type:complete len:215 (-) Transcript_11025:8035-8679(-)
MMRWLVRQRCGSRCRIRLSHAGGQEAGDGSHVVLRQRFQSLLVQFLLPLCSACLLVGRGFGRLILAALEGAGEHGLEQALCWLLGRRCCCCCRILLRLREEVVPELGELAVGEGDGHGMHKQVQVVVDHAVLRGHPQHGSCPHRRVIVPGLVGIPGADDGAALPVGAALPGAPAAAAAGGAAAAAGLLDLDALDDELAEPRVVLVTGHGKLEAG